MSARDELAREIFITDNSHARRAVMEAEWAERSRGYRYAYGIADGLLAAGYQKLPLTLDSLPTHPTNSSRGNEQDRSNGSQPQQPLHHNTNHSQDQPKSQQNNHQGSHAQSIRPTPDEWNGAGIAPEAIEAAEKAWQDYTGDDQTPLLDEFVVALEAAAPLIAAHAQAEALKEAADAMKLPGVKPRPEWIFDDGYAAATNDAVGYLNARAATIESGAS